MLDDVQVTNQSPYKTLLWWCLSSYTHPEPVVSWSSCRGWWIKPFLFNLRASPVLDWHQVAA